MKICMVSTNFFRASGRFFEKSNKPQANDKHSIISVMPYSPVRINYNIYSINFAYSPLIFANLKTKSGGILTKPE